MVDMLSEELYAAIDERKELLKTLQVADSNDANEENGLMSCLDEATERISSKLEKSQSGDIVPRSISPTSPLDCCLLPNEENRNFDTLPKLCIKGLSSNQVYKGKRNGGSMDSFYSEPLPTSRGHTSIHVDSSEDLHPDMNNALSDSDEDGDVAAIAADESHGGGTAHRSRRTHVSSLEYELRARAKQERSSGPQCWIPNTAFASSILHMIQPGEDETKGNKDRIVNQFSRSSVNRSQRRATSTAELVRSHPSSIAMRSYETELFERVLQVPRLTFDLKQARNALRKKDKQISILSEKLNSSRLEAEEEVAQKCRDAKHLQEQLRAAEEKLKKANASKFLLFGQLQTAEARLREMEETKNKNRVSIEEEAGTAVGSPVGALKDRKTSVLSSDTIDLSLEAQNAFRQRRSSLSPEPFPRKVSQLVNDHPLRETVSQIYEQLFLTDKRGDDLLQRVQEVEKPSRRGKKNPTTTNIQSKTKTKATTLKSKPRKMNNTRKPESELSNNVRGRVARGTLAHCARPETRPKETRVPRQGKTTSKQIKPLSKSTRWRL
eukprot:g6727.t1